MTTKGKKADAKRKRPTPNPKSVERAMTVLGGKLPEGKAERRPKGQRSEASQELIAKMEEASKNHGKPVYKVAEGATIHTKRGELGPGTPVLPKDFPEGTKTIVDLVREKLLVRIR